MPTLRSDEGQATVELVALLPFVGVLIALLWQFALAGTAIWLSGGAARAAARAEAVGSDPLRAARGVLPGRLEHGLKVRRERDGAIALVMQIPAVLGSGALTSITTRAHFEAQR
jgi:pilus assembly protein CpaE